VIITTSVSGKINSLFPHFLKSGGDLLHVAWTDIDLRGGVGFETSMGSKAREAAREG